MHVAWISGWGVVPGALKLLTDFFPAEASHSFLPPTAESAQACVKSDLTIGWSLGALRILDAAAGGAQFAGRVWLLAPFLDFCSDHNNGGRCAVIQVKWLRRWLTRGPHAALADFYERAGLGKPPTELPYAMEDLLAGLDRLAEPASPSLREFVRRGLPGSWHAAVGDQDPLLEGTRICEVIAGCRLVAGADHRAGKLFAAIAREDHARKESADAV